MRIVYAALVILALPSTALAGDYTCTSNRIEKGGSTWGAYVDTGGDWRIEKSSSTIGYAKKANSDWRIETSGGSTLGYLKSDRIESSGGSTIGSLSDARSFANNCSDAVAVALWILNKEGKL